MVIVSPESPSLTSNNDGYCHSIGRSVSKCVQTEDALGFVTEMISPPTEVQSRVNSNRTGVAVSTSVSSKTLY